MSRIEHVNVTVSDPERSAELMVGIFGWHIRWSGPARSGGRTIHVGMDDNYVAVYAEPPGKRSDDQSLGSGRLNHIGVEVDDLELVEERVRKAGLRPTDLETYEPGRRFYFFDPDGIEFEVVSYAPVAAARPG